MAAVGMMKSLSFGLALAPIFVAGCIPVYSQVKPGQSINSPFTTYEDADLTDPGAFSIGQYVSFVRTGSGNSVSATGVDFSSTPCYTFETAYVTACAGSFLFHSTRSASSFS
jgi:hypothetical protein